MYETIIDKECDQEVISRHIHLSAHPGYNLKRPKEFFQEYGDYVLNLLRIVKHGCNLKHNCIPPLTISGILLEP